MDGGEEEEELNKLRDYMTVFTRTPLRLRFQIMEVWRIWFAVREDRTIS